MIENDHLGYVFSSSYCSDDEARAEARGIWPDMTNERMVRFRSGRHDRLWVGNVYAVGNVGTILHSTGNGTWAGQTSGTGNVLYGVWGSAASDIYAVGASTLARNSHTASNTTPARPLVA